MPELNNAARPLLNKRRKTLLVIGLGTFVLLGIFFWGMMLSPEAYGPNYSARRLAPCAAHLFGTDNHAKLTASLDSISLGNTRMGESDALHLLEPADIGLDDLATGTGTGAGNSVADHHDRGDERSHLDLLVVSADGIADFGFLLMFLGYLHTHKSVRQLGLLLADLADIVEQAGPLGSLDVQAKLCGHCGTEIGHLAGVLQQILSV